MTDRATGSWNSIRRVAATAKPSPALIVFLALCFGPAGCDRWAIDGEPQLKAPPGAPIPGDVAGPREVDRNVRVVLLEGADSFEFAVHGPFTIRDKNGRPIEPGKGRRLPRTVGSIDRSGGIWLRLGTFTTNSPQVDIIPVKSGTVEVTVPANGGRPQRRRFRGGLRVCVTSAPAIDVINVVDVEEYLRGVMCGEMPASFHIEAFKAQAIAARTYALYQKATAGKSQHWDVKATESSQMYIGLEGERRSRRAMQAVAETTGLVCTWDSPHGRKIFCTYYSSTCGGRTQSVANVKGRRAWIPPLAGGVPCTYCSISRNYRWPPVELTRNFVTDRLFRSERFAHLRKLKGIEDVRVESATNTGRPVQLQLTGLNGRTAMIRAEDFRLLIGGHKLKSTNFRLVVTPTHFVFTDGKGFGHGVGMCQYGAQVQARQGRKAPQILAYYYPGSHLEQAYH